MCRAVLIDDAYCDTVGELREACGSVVFLEEYRGYGSDANCLCNVNHAATSALIGRKPRKTVCDVVYEKP